MRKALRVLAISCAVFVNGAAQDSSSETKQRDASEIIIRSLQASGTRDIGSIQDLRATGIVTYFWAGEEVKGTATVQMRSADQYRLDAQLPQGTRSVVINGRAGSIRDTEGNVTQLSANNLVGFVSPVFPAKSLHNLFASQAKASSADATVADDHATHKIHINRRQHTREVDPEGKLAATEALDVFIGKTNFQIVKIANKVHPENNFQEDYDHEIVYSDFREVQGMIVPFVITEFIAGQKISAIQLENVTFNNDLTDATFAF